MSPYRVCRLALFILFVGVVVVGLYRLTGPAYAGLGAVLGILVGYFSPLHAYLVPKVPHLPIQRLEEYLGKGKDHRPQRFRDFGPRWVDFEAASDKDGYIYHRPEVDDLWARLVTKKEKRVLLCGEPASGKSVIAFDVGYRFAHQSWWRPGHVYYHALKRGSLDGGSIDKLVDGLQQYPEPVLLILDDVHLDVALGMRVLREVKEPNVHWLVVGQPQLEKQQLPQPGDRHPLVALCGDERVDVSSAAGFEEIVKWGVLRQLGREAEEAEIRALRQECGNDLLFLTRYLRGLEPRQGGFDIAKAREAVYKEVEEDLVSLSEAVGDKAPELLLLISAFFQYEVGVAPEPFLTENCKYSPSVINELVRRGQLRQEDSAQGGRLLTLYHESLAKLYLKGGEERAFFWLGALKNTFNPWPAALFGEYIVSVPCNGTRFANVLWLHSWVEQSSLFHDVLSEDRVRRALAKSFAYARPEEVGSCLASILRSDAGWAKEVWDRPGAKEGIISAVNRGDVKGIGRCIRDIHSCDHLWAREVWDAVGVREKVIGSAKQAEAGALGCCLSDLHDCEPGWAKHVWDAEGVREALLDALAKAEAEQIGVCLELTHHCDPTWADWIWGQPSVKEVVAQALRRADAGSLGACLYALHKCNSSWPQQVAYAPGVKEAAFEALKRADAIGAIRLLTALVVCEVKWGVSAEPWFWGAFEKALETAHFLELVIAFGLFYLDDEVIDKMPADIRPLMRDFKEKAKKGKGGEHD